MLCVLKYVTCMPDMKINVGMHSDILLHCSVCVFSACCHLGLALFEWVEGIFPPGITCCLLQACVCAAVAGEDVAQAAGPGPAQAQRRRLIRETSPCLQCSCGVGGTSGQLTMVLQYFLRHFTENSFHSFVLRQFLILT